MSGSAPTSAPQTLGSCLWVQWQLWGRWVRGAALHMPLWEALHAQDDRGRRSGRAASPRGEAGLRGEPLTCGVVHLDAATDGTSGCRTASAVTHRELQTGLPWAQPAQRVWPAGGAGPQEARGPPQVSTAHVLREPFSVSGPQHPKPDGGQGGQGLPLTPLSL